MQRLLCLAAQTERTTKTIKCRTSLKGIREARAANIPYLGICLGMQTLVKASGGKVVRSPVKEIGFRDPENNRFIVNLTEEGKRDPLFAGLDHTFDVFQLHGETVELTQEMALLATGEYCENQVVKIGSNAYGIQCHFELTPEMFEIWINEDPDLLTLNKGKLRTDFESTKVECAQVGRRLLQKLPEDCRILSIPPSSINSNPSPSD